MEAIWDFIPGAAEGPILGRILGRDLLKQKVLTFENAWNTRIETCRGRYFPISLKRVGFEVFLDFFPVSKISEAPSKSDFFQFSSVKETVDREAGMFDKLFGYDFIIS